MRRICDGVRSSSGNVMQCALRYLLFEDLWMTLVLHRVLHRMLQYAPIEHNCITIYRFSQFIWRFLDVSATWIADWSGMDKWILDIDGFWEHLSLVSLVSRESCESCESCASRNWVGQVDARAEHRAAVAASHAHLEFVLRDALSRALASAVKKPQPWGQQHRDTAT